MQTITVESALDAVLHLTPEQQDALIDIVKARRTESREQEWSDAVELTLAAYRSGEIKAQSAEDAIRELRREVQ